MLTKTIPPIHQKVLRLLVERDFVEASQIEKLLDRHYPMSKIVSELLDRQKVTEENLAKLFAVAYDVPLVRLVGKVIPSEVLKIIPENLARKYLMIAYEKHGRRIMVAIGQPYRLAVSKSGPLHELEREHGVDFSIAITTRADVLWALTGYNRVEVSLDQSKADQEKRLPFANLESVEIPQAVLGKFPEDIARKYHMVVFEAPADDIFQVALVYPNDPQATEILDYISKRNNLTIKQFQTSQKGFEKALLGYRNQINSTQVDVSPPVPIPKTKPTDQSPKSQLKITSPSLEEPTGVASHRPLYDKQVIEGIPTLIDKTSLPGQATQVYSAEDDSENLQESNLDKLLKASVNSIDDLIKIIMTGYIPKVVAAIVGYAVNRQASDIHLEPMENYFRLRVRVDGVLQEVLRLPKSLQPAILSRIKILSNLKIDEQRIPQDGRFDAQSQKHLVDLRVSTLPTVYGEKVVIRILDKSSGLLTLEQLGLDGVNFDRIVEGIKRPWGVIMATGPTGSGKSTTLYAILNRISSIKVNVITLEDPVEYAIAGVNQAQVKPKIGFSFAEGLRSVLRQDPNVIMVGEIRDRETAELVTHAALTGHLVLTTLHTNDAASALPRLINIGVEPFLITSAMNAIIAQRLVRRLCQQCRQPTKLPEPVLEKIKKDFGSNTPESKMFYAAQGCDRCAEGFKGRVGIFEVIMMSDTLELAALQRKPASVLLDIASREGMVTMRQDGIMKATKGLTTIDEVIKATSA